MGSKFKGIFDAAKARTDEATPDLPPAAAEASAPAAPARSRAAGRSPAKRDNPDYQQISAYVRRDTYNAVKIKLLRDNDEREISELVEELFTAWLRS